MAALCRTGTPVSGNDQCPQDVRTDAGVVERGGLENRCASNGTQGSNPCLSASLFPLFSARAGAPLALRLAGAFSIPISIPAAVAWKSDALFRMRESGGAVC